MKRTTGFCLIFLMLFALPACSDYQTKSTFSLNQQVVLKMYLPSPDETKLEEHDVLIPKLDALSMAKVALKRIWDEADKENMTALFPKTDKHIGMELRNNTIVIDLPKEIQDKHIGGTTGELLTVYSIVNTLTGISGIDSVKFLIDGKLVDEFKGHLDFAGIFCADQNM